jgi:hypothetical protein
MKIILLLVMINLVGCSKLNLSDFGWSRINNLNVGDCFYLSEIRKYEWIVNDEHDRAVYKIISRKKAYVSLAPLNEPDSILTWDKEKQKAVDYMVFRTSCSRE